MAKRPIPFKAIKAALKSPRTPTRLKKGLRKLIKRLKIGATRTSRAVARVKGFTSLFK